MALQLCSRRSQTSDKQPNYKIEKLHWPTCEAVTICVDEAGPADAPLTYPATQPLLVAAHERPQSAANDLDFPEGPAPKFYLSLEGTNVL